MSPDGSGIPASAGYSGQRDGISKEALFSGLLKLWIIQKYVLLQISSQMKCQNPHSSTLLILVKDFDSEKEITLDPPNQNRTYFNKLSFYCTVKRHFDRNLFYVSPRCGWRLHSFSQIKLNGK